MNFTVCKLYLNKPRLHSHTLRMILLELAGIRCRGTGSGLLPVLYIEILWQFLFVKSSAAKNIWKPLYKINVSGGPLRLLKRETLSLFFFFFKIYLTTR